MVQARAAADRIFTLEHCGLSLPHLARLARSELRNGCNPAAALLDSLALAAIAAQRSLGLRPHLAQLTATAVLLQGGAAELGAGEGKSLALGLAAAVRALAGSTVHIVTRDEASAIGMAAALGPLFASLGLTVGVVREAADAAARREAYRADVCHASAGDLMLDHLRDRQQVPAETTGCRPELASAMVDDMDAILIDEAVVPCALPDTRSGCGDAARTTAQECTTAQEFFRRYRNLGGVSATLLESSAEMAAVYGVAVTAIASIYPSFRHDLGLKLLASPPDWRRAVVCRIQALVAARRPVLVATPDPAGSRELAAALLEAGIDAAVVTGTDSTVGPRGRAPAGLPGRVTVCVDPRGGSEAAALDPYARAAGGLAVIATYLGTSRRDDRRLSQLTGRQGQPGSFETIAAAPAGLAAMPAPLIRSLVRVSRYLREKAAEFSRRRHARLLAVPDDPAVPSVRRRHPTLLQTEGR